ncbi:uncharacterized protein LOC125554313 [Triticum urartu]|uniref:uncharacterized protein LOC125554313 n=1 Tax=Triticum urartu TaxID=4572 RepID=UPI0020446F4B|nr:uncharacterized protein LOC125554313 [Triticum urartu]
MSVQVASPATAAEKTLATTAWSYPYVEYMAQWERQVERRQLFLRSYHFSRDAEISTRVRARRVVLAGARRLRRAAAKGLRRLRTRLRLCFGWAAPVLRRRSTSRRGGVHGFRYGRLPRKTPPAASVCFW